MKKGQFCKNPEHLNLNHLIFNHFMKKMSEQNIFFFQILDQKPPSSTLASNFRGRNIFLILHSKNLPFFIVYLGRKSEASKNSFWQVALRRAWAAAAEKKALYLATNALTFLRWVNLRKFFKLLQSPKKCAKKLF